MLALPPLPSTHEILNQVPPHEGWNLFERDAPLQEGVEREGAGGERDRLAALGARAGSAEVQGWAADANRYGPTLRTHDRQGRRIDQVDYHPTYHQLMALSVSEGLHSSPWDGGPWDGGARDGGPGEGAHVARAAGFYLMAQTDLGHGCPISMTCSIVPALRAEPALAAIWEPRARSRSYDPRFLPADQKAGAIFGMAMTEKQGGSDVRANTTRAEPLGVRIDEADAYAITGHKFFCSAPMSDGFLMLAQAPGGLTCFLVPRFLPDGTPNRIQVQRLKDKVGNRSNASSEIELLGALGLRVAEEGRGVRTIMEMSNHTRLDCVIGSSALMRQGLALALHHARHRRAFGRALVDQPLMRGVLADLALESEAATTFMLRLARTYDEQDEASVALRRVLTPVGKFWVCKRATSVLAEAMECLGGVGYVEELPLARAWREVPLYPIWEGSGNVICLDVVRAITRTKGAVDALSAELGAALGQDGRYDAFVGALRRELPALLQDEAGARALTSRLGLAVQASLLLRHAPEAVSGAFCATRLGQGVAPLYGAGGAIAGAEALLERALP